MASADSRRRVNTVKTELEANFDDMYTNHSRVSFLPFDSPPPIFWGEASVVINALPLGQGGVRFFASSPEASR
jgi:hypothetical protein